MGLMGSKQEGPELAPPLVRKKWTDPVLWPGRSMSIWCGCVADLARKLLCTFDFKGVKCTINSNKRVNIHFFCLLKDNSTETLIMSCVCVYIYLLQVSCLTMGWTALAVCFSHWQCTRQLDEVQRGVAPLSSVTGL